MNNNGISSSATSFGISLAAASIANALLVIAKEKSPKVLAEMQELTGHHWITHCLLIILLFIILGFILSRWNGGRGPKTSVASLTVAVVGGVV